MSIDWIVEAVKTVIEKEKLNLEIRDGRDWERLGGLKWEISRDKTMGKGNKNQLSK